MYQFPENSMNDSHLAGEFAPAPGKKLFKNTKPKKIRK
jgi:hypothetical protein